MACPDYSLSFVVEIDASGYGLVAALFQRHKDGEKAIAYFSRSLTKALSEFPVRVSRKGNARLAFSSGVIFSTAA